MDIKLIDFDSAIDVKRTLTIYEDMISHDYKTCGYGYDETEYYFARKMKSGSLIINNEKN
jgi:hypothetical protein